MKKILFLVAGTKGGIGKSFFAIHAASAAKDLGLEVKMFDCDTENKTSKSFMKDECIFLDDVNIDYPLDPVINSFFADKSHVTIVDTKAGTSRTLLEWCRSVPFEEFDPKKHIFVIVGCFTSDPDCVKTFSRWVDDFQKLDYPVRFLLVKNEKDGKDFDFLNAYVAGESLKNSDCTVLTFPAINQQYVQRINLYTVLIRDIVRGVDKDSFKTIMERSRLRRYYQDLTDSLINVYGNVFSAGDLTPLGKSVLECVRNRLKQKGQLTDGKESKP